jgi:hypothetical protein
MFCPLAGVLLTLDNSRAVETAATPFLDLVDGWLQQQGCELEEVSKAGGWRALSCCSLRLQHVDFHYFSLWGPQQGNSMSAQAFFSKRLAVRGTALNVNEGRKGHSLVPRVLHLATLLAAL